jgi:predicted nucleic acid-binding protein
MDPWPYGDKIYLDTSLFYYYLDNRRDYSPETNRIFDEINAKKFKAYTSIFVIKEMLNGNAKICKKMIAIIKENNIPIVSASYEILKIANLYITNNVIPINYITYALNLATCIANRLDYLITFDEEYLSYHYRTIFNNKLIQPYSTKDLRICPPMEVIDYAEEDIFTI